MTEFETRRLSQNDDLPGSPEESFDRDEPHRYSHTVLGPMLEQLEEQGAIVFDDVPGKDFQLEHVAIHPTGVYVLENVATAGQDHTVVNFDGTSMRLNNEPADEPIARAKAASAWLRELLQSATGRTVLVRPTLVFPGWFVESEQPLDADMLVLPSHRPVRPVTCPASSTMPGPC